MQGLNMSSCDLEVITKRGCNKLATKRISKTASINSISKHQRATRFIVWYIIVIMAVSIMGTDAKPTHRHMNKHPADEVYRPRQISKRSHPASNSPDDWNNPCGGKFDGSKPTQRMSTKNALHFLRKAARSAYNTLKSNEKQPINIQDMSTWDMHKNNYKFIPKLTRNSSIALKRWYRNMQTYVAGFSYLHNVQQANDRSVQSGFGVSNELRLLMEQARSVLCEIETTINRTSAGQNVKFSPVSQIEMDKRLKFTTRLRAKNSNEIDMYDVDLKYMKHHFMNFLNTMKILLGEQNRKNNIQGSQSESDSRSVASNEVNTSRSQSVGKKHRPAHNKRRQNKKTKQRIIQNNSLSSS